jgi:hypothetical protein
MERRNEKAKRRKQKKTALDGLGDSLEGYRIGTARLKSIVSRLPCKTEVKV